MAFTRQQGDYEIFVMNPDGSKQKNRTNNSVTDEDSYWQPIVP
jgi:hypothetical protein